MADNQPIVDDPTTTPPVDDQDPGEDRNLEDADSSSVEDTPDGDSAAQRRIRRLSADKRTALEERDYWRNVATRQAQLDAQAVAQQPAPNANQISDTPSYSGDEVDRAFRTLKDRGMVTREELNEIVLRQQWDQMHEKNQQEVRKQGLPDYDRDEVEAYARQKGISDPMAAYRDMYFDEIIDAARKRSGTRTAVTSEKPSKPSTSAREPMTLDSFREKLASSDGKDYYEQLLSDPKKFDELLQQLSE